MACGAIEFGQTDWLSVREAAALLGGVSARTVYRLFEDGELRGVRVRGCVRILRDSAAAYFAAHCNGQATTAAEPAAVLAPPPATTKPQRAKRRGRRPVGYVYFPLRP